MVKMASLKNGVLLKLLEDMKMDDIALDDDPKPVLLQIRSIIPVLEEGDLWPNRGFFLKVSDLSHAFYVSLTDQQNEMILGNKLKLGQLIYVEKLEKAEPAPLLKGVTPVPGRRPCEGTPVDIVPPPNLAKLLEASGVDSVVEKGVILEKKISKTQTISRKLMRGTSGSESSVKRNERLKGGYEGRCRSPSASKARRSEVSFALKAEDFEKVTSPDECRLSSVDNDSDGESVILSSSSAHMAKRRSWTESEIMGVKEIFDSSAVNLFKFKLFSFNDNDICRICYVVSPVRSVGYDSSDDNLSSTTTRRASSVGSGKRLIKNSSKSQTPASKVNNVQIPNSLCSLKGAETGISWNSLPPNLVKFGKEVIRQRDIALSAAADALQEACASERLLSSLSTLSQFPLGEGEDLQPYVDKFFELQHDLARTRLIMQSLTSITPLRTQESDSCMTNTVKETLTVALERKKNAIGWIKSAVAVDLSPSSAPNFPSSNSVETTNSLKKTSPSSRSNKPKGACIIKKGRSSADITVLLASDKGDNQGEWTRGSTLPAAADLAASLQDECRKLFLSYVETYLDELEQKSSSMQSDSQIAAMMYKVKMVNDCLDVIVNIEGNPREGGRGGCGYLEDSEAEAYRRVRNKIYGILLKHVERTAMVLERLNGAT
ncbi:UNVERIFIED_CONTAM: hypothetical protein Sradi_2825400 [Sesamum radiatum]|uniref:Uncharacterized protein n=1 Tax=Sesamum radiatum TaxID=300843 RepID=A0AAW2RXW9_SESRA